MPRTVDQILQHAAELGPEAVALLRATIQERSDAERHLVDAIKTARHAGMSWAAIGTTGDAARQHYASGTTPATN